MIDLKTDKEKKSKIRHEAGSVFPCKHCGKLVRKIHNDIGKTIVVNVKGVYGYTPIVTKGLHGIYLGKKLPVMYKEAITFTKHECKNKKEKK